MERITRAIFFWTLVAAFIIITPLVILYANGYKFDFTRGVFVHSGTIFFKSNPQNITSELNGEMLDSAKINISSNAYSISGLIPDTYDLSISAPDFQTWQKKIDVHSGLASEFWNVLLVRNEYRKTDYATLGIEKFFISPKGTYIIYTQKTENGLAANILNIEDKQIEKTFNFADWEFIPEERMENIEWSPEEDYISVPVRKIIKQSILTQDPEEQSSPYTYFIIDPAKGTSFNLNGLLKNNNLSYVRWDPKDKDYLFYLSDETLYRANINDVSDITEIAKDVSSFDLSQTNVYYSQMPNEIVYKTDLDGQGTVKQITSDFPEDITKNFRLIAYDDARIAFLTENKNLYIFNAGEMDSYFRKLGENIEGIQFSDDGKKLLYWTKNDISTYYLRNWNVQPNRFENSIEEITRYSDQIKNVQWFKDYEHIIFSVGPQMKIIELDPRDHRNCMDLLKTASSTPLAGYNHAQERLYFVDTKDSSSSLYSIIFPEPTPILGIYTPSQE